MCDIDDISGLHRPAVYLSWWRKENSVMHMFPSSYPAAGCPWKTASSGVSSAPCASSSSSTSSFSSSPSGSSPRSSPASTQTSLSYTKWSQSVCLFAALCESSHAVVMCEVINMTLAYSHAQASTELIHMLVKLHSFGSWKMLRWKECEGFWGWGNVKNVFTVLALLCNGVLQRDFSPQIHLCMLLLHSTTLYKNLQLQNTS